MSAVEVVQRYPLRSFFLLTFSISWLGAFSVAAPYLLRHQTPPRIAGILMFPVMLLGPSLSSIALTRMVGGPAALGALVSRMGRVRLPARWYAALLIPPLAILAALFCLRTLASPVFAPGMFLMGLLFGCPAGLLEEIGWMGFAFPRMSRASSPLFASIVLGLLWSLWHLPVMDYLGSATPHGAYTLHYFLAFSCAMTAIRVVIAWLYSNTGSVLLSQLLHACSTSALVVFSPPRVNPGQEALWYFAYGILLWLLVAIIGLGWGRNLVRRGSGAEVADVIGVAR
jgi:membrane protease YdiL (CAAX protease family)